MTHRRFCLFVVLLLCVGATVALAQDQADLSITLTGPWSATFGDRIPYSLSVENLGPATASNVAINFSVAPSSFPVFSSGICSGGFPCAIGELASGQSISLPNIYVQTPYLFCPSCNDPAP